MADAVEMSIVAGIPMLETSFSDLSFRVLAQECGRRRNEALDEVRERVAGFLAVALVLAVPFCYVISGPGIALVEPSEAAEPATGPNVFQAPALNTAAVLNLLEADKLSRTDVRTIQTQLKLKGFNPGPVDGLAGQRTLAALNRYRQSQQLPPVHALNRETATALLKR